jgi:hypothetical protein
MTKLAPPLIDPWHSAPVFADNLARINSHGPITHLVFAYTQHDPCDGAEGVKVRTIVTTLIVPTEILPILVRQLACRSTDLEYAADRDEAVPLQ